MLLSQAEERIYRITLNRPEKRNALNREARQALLSALDECLPKASVIILAGAGRYVLRRDGSHPAHVRPRRG